LRSRAGELPAVPATGLKKIHKSFDDPPFLAKSAKSKEEVLDIYRRVRDEIKIFVEKLPDSLKSDS
jgi:arsenate reductase